MDFFRLSGPDRYCPYCKRLLVKVYDDGTYDLSGDAAIEGTQTVTWSKDNEPESEEVSFEAQCLRKRCRLRTLVSSAIRS